MNVPANSNGSTQKQLGADPKQDQGVPGEPKEMSDPEVSSMSTSSPTPTPTGSPSMTGSRSSSKPSEMDESPASSSSAPTEGSSSTSQQPIFDADTQRDREGTLIIHFSTFGTKEQKQKTAENMVRNIRLKGFGIVHASIDGTEIPVE